MKIVKKNIIWEVHSLLSRNRNNHQVVNSHLSHFLSVLFIADVKVTFDDFKRCMIATCDHKTVITANPSKII